ncbi:helix-turn-helix transcriptional regulator [Dactylosporangium darangshiense]|uniref:LuxR family transcriptional regulator n=1 Tax=Dactylosporangium darangshiense TaxID=579108 RepID=A0ABP8DV10_9ACTN
MSQVILRGRSEAMSSIIASLRHAIKNGQSSIVLVTGEAGIGKSALLDAVSSQSLGMKFAVGTSKADQINQITPGAALLLAVRSGVRPLVDADAFAKLERLSGQPLLLVDEMGTQLERITASTPALIAVDDVHWADKLTVFALRTLSARLAGSPIVWMLTSRDGNTGLIADLRIDRVPAVSVRSIHLGPLAPEHVLGIAADRLGGVPSNAIRRMLAGVDGNPFMAVQIVHGLSVARAMGEPDDQVPTEFIAGVRSRLTALPSGETELVRTAVVLGRPFGFDEAVGLLPGHSSASVAARIRDAVRSGLLTYRGHRIAVRHDLVRETIYADLSDAVRRALHRRCAEYLMSAGHSALTVAPHASAGATFGDEESAALLSRAAAEAVTALPDTAAELALKAFELLRPGQPAWLATGEHSIEVLSRVQRCADTVAVADKLLVRVDDVETVARIQVVAARAQWLMGRLAESVSRVEETLLRPGISAELQARLRSSRALALTSMKPAEVARKTAEPALAEARLVGDTEAIVVALQAVGEVAKNSGHHAESLALFRELRTVAGATYLAQEIMALQLLDRHDDAEMMLTAARSDASNEVEAILPSLLYAQMWQDFSLGRTDEAESGARTLITLSRELGNHVHELEATTILTALALLRGDIGGAQELLAQVESHTGADDYVRMRGQELVHGWRAWLSGDLEEAAATLAPVLYAARECRSHWPWRPGWLRMFVQLGMALNDTRLAEEAAAIAEDGAARNPGVPSFEGVALQLRGLVTADLDLLGRASEVLRSTPRPIVQASVAEDYGLALLRAGQKPEGLIQLDRAWDIYHQVGAWAAMASVEQAMSRTGVRYPKWGARTVRPSTGWAALTEAEMKVARLIGAGHTNRSAAGELGVSPNTVGTHMRSIFAKVGVRSRVQLTNALHRHDEENA